MVIVSVSSTLVNVAEDAELRLIRLLADSAPPSLLSTTFVQNCEACIMNADASGLIKTVISDSGAVSALFVMEPIDEAISALSLLAALLDRVNDDNVKTQLTRHFADAITKVNSLSSPGATKTTQQLGERKIALLSVLYNMRPDTQDKKLLLTRMIGLAGQYAPSFLEAGQPIGRLLHEDESLSTPPALEGALDAISSSFLGPPAPRIVSMLDSWNIPKSERRDLYRAVADGITDFSIKQRFLLLIVESYDTPKINDQGLKSAQEAALGAIKDPVTLFVHQRNMLSLPAIQALSKKKGTAALYGLLKVFQEGKLEDYNAFLKKSGGEKNVLKPLGLSGDECVRYMRILSFCSLAAQHEEIPYSTVKETLLLSSEDDVESWVIAAVSSSLLSAKMDQLQRKVMVERCVVRKFGLEQWKILQKRLQSWKGNVNNVIQGLKQAEQASSASQQLGDPTTAVTAK